MNVIEAQNLSVSYDGNTVFSGVSVAIERGAFVGIIGPNGSGKTTLLKALIGLIPLDSGEVRILGHDARREISLIRREIGYLPQKASINPMVPVLVRDAVLMGRYGTIGLFRRPKMEDYRAVEEALKKVDMIDKIDEPIGHLSGGQQQRVFIARALVHNPKIIFLDEPTTGLDVPSQSSIINLIKELHDRYELTVMMVTHDINQISAYASKILYINRKIVAEGDVNSVCRSEVLREVYNTDVKVVKYQGMPCVVVNDQHMHGGDEYA